MDASNSNKPSLLRTNPHFIKPMRPKILLICGIVLAFCIWLLLYQAGKQQKVLANKSDEVATNQLNQLRQPQQPDVTTESFSNSNIKSSVSQAVPNTNHAA